MTAWLDPSREGGLYEAVRRGDEDAFAVLATSLQPTLHRIAALYASDDSAASDIVLRCWDSTLDGLHMFQWRVPLATWICRSAVVAGRARGRAAPARSRRTARAPALVGSPPGPDDWADLPWGARWQHAGVTLEGVLAGLPTDQLEVVHGRDVEHWPDVRVCDVFGLTRAGYDRRLTVAHEHLHAVLAGHVGVAGPGDDHEAQVAHVMTWIGTSTAASPTSVDPRVFEAFRRHAGRGHSRWRRLVPGPWDPGRTT